MCVCLDICRGRMEGTFLKGGENNGPAKEVHISGLYLGREIGICGKEIREILENNVLTEI